MEMSEIYNGNQWAHDIFLVNKAGDKVRMYEEIMMNDDNLESSLLTSSLLKCVLWYKLNCVFTVWWQEMNWLLVCYAI